MASRQCYHCKQTVQEGEAHDCWTTTEAALTRDLSEDLRDAWERLREAAAALGEQRIYASHSSIMFSRKSCYVFVRPKKHFLEVCIFLGRALKGPQVRRSDAASTTKVANVLRIQHRDEVEAPVTDWIQEAYEWSAAPRAAVIAKPATPGSRASTKQKAAANKATAAKTSARKNAGKKMSRRTPQGR